MRGLHKKIKAKRCLIYCRDAGTLSQLTRYKNNCVITHEFIP